MIRRAAARRVDGARIAPWRARYLAELDAQCRYDATHRRGWADVYAVSLDGLDVGYGAIKGCDEIAARDSLFEFHVDPPVRSWAVSLARAVLAAAGATRLQCQTNDAGTFDVFRQLAARVEVEAILFADDHATDLVVPGAIARTRRDDDGGIFEHTAEPVGDVVVEYDGAIVATGGALTHYNPPYADLYMEVRPDVRRRGFGSLVLQAVKRACAEQGLVPAARTGVTNLASQATLRRAGLRECGFVLAGRVTPDVSADA
jgi:GNAT superfamily N-acetyltransferase